MKHSLGLALGWALALSLLAGCPATIDTEGIPSIENYTSWTSLVTEGNAPPHGDAARIIYINDAGLQYRGGDDYPLGTTIVKEILVGDANSAIDYIAVMRRLDEAPGGGKLEDGWQFTMAEDGDDDEIQGITCFDQCHVQAPFAGTWFDYGTLVP